MLAYRAICAVGVVSLLAGWGTWAEAAAETQTTSPATTPRRMGVDPDRRRLEISRLARELNSQFNRTERETSSAPMPSLRDLGLVENNFGHTYFYYPLHLRSFFYNPGQRRFHVNYRQWFGYRSYYYHPRFTPYCPFPGYGYPSSAYPYPGHWYWN